MEEIEFIIVFMKQCYFIQKLRFQAYSNREVSREVKLKCPLDSVNDFIANLHVFISISFVIFLDETNRWIGIQKNSRIMLRK